MTHTPLHTYIHTAKWYRVDWQQGSGDNLFSTNTWAKTSVSGKRVYAGKWGHRLQHYHRLVSDRLSQQQQQRSSNLYSNLTSILYQ